MIDATDTVTADLIDAASIDANPTELPMAEEKPTESAEDAIKRLAALDFLEYERVRKDEAKALGMRPSVLDMAVKGARPSSGESGNSAMFVEVEPWPDEVDAAAVLDELRAILGRFIVCNNETAVAASLWIAFTWFIDVVQVSPLGMITAPERRCGKTQLLSLIGSVARRPLVASNISPAATFRVIEAHSPTLLIDEADAFLRDNEEMRGVLNSGHTRQSAYVIRTVGDDHEPKQFSTWGAKAISGIGHMHETLMDRSVVMELRRKLPSESVERLRHAEPGLFQRQARKLARLAEDHADAIRRARPELPDALNDRAQDNWEPLLAIADLAGGHWPRLARDAALRISGGEHESKSLTAELLEDVRGIFEARRVERMRSTDLLSALIEDDERPWATYNRGRQMSPHQLSKRLSEYGIRPKTQRMGADRGKGYDLADMRDAFDRYLAVGEAPPKIGDTVTSKDSCGFPCSPMKNGHGDTPQRIGDMSAGSNRSADPAMSPISRAVTVTQNGSVTRKPAQTLGCHGVTDMPPVSDENSEVL
jgi:putative DNA primase/helicase